jgi:hypothetical protein
VVAHGLCAEHQPKKAGEAPAAATAAAPTPAAT